MRIGTPANGVEDRTEKPTETISVVESAPDNSPRIFNEICAAHADEFNRKIPIISRISSNDDPPETFCPLKHADSCPIEESGCPITKKPSSY